MTSSHYVGIADEFCPDIVRSFLDTLREQTPDQPVSGGDISIVAKELRYILEVVEQDHERTRADYYQPRNVMLHDKLEEWKDQVEWKRLNDFMSARAKASPYPPILYRSHTHGSPFPRFIDDSSGRYCGTFGSDLHLEQEFETSGSVCVPVSRPGDMYTPKELVRVVAEHLCKTQINNDRIRAGEELYLSPLVSLSGDMLWATQNARQKGAKARKDQVAGLAIFDTARIKGEGATLWRVKDLFDYFGKNPRFESREKIDSYARTWAKNSDEYVCWDLLPHEALLNFVPFSRLVQKGCDREKAFLRDEFIKSANLGYFKRDTRFAPRVLAMDQYVSRVSAFLSTLVSRDDSDTDTYYHLDIDVSTLAANTMERFEDAYHWGYTVREERKTVQESLRLAMNRNVIPRPPVESGPAQAPVEFQRRKPQDCRIMG